MEFYQIYFKTHCMKTKSALLLLTGAAIGAIAGILLVPQKGIKNRKQILKKSKKYKKAFKETASKYKEKLGDNIRPVRIM